jgi:hypothetical protein
MFTVKQAFHSYSGAVVYPFIGDINEIHIVFGLLIYVFRDTKVLYM